MMGDLLAQLDRLPPCITRLLARDEETGRMLSLHGIERLSGLHRRDILRISRQGSWENITVGEALKFSKACGVDLLRPRRKLSYLRRAVAMKSRAFFGKGIAKGKMRKYVVRQIDLWRIRYEQEAERANRRRAGKSSG